MRAEFCIFESNAPGLKANFYEPYVDKPNCNQQQNFRILKGYLFSEGYLFTGFYGSAQNSAIFARHEIVLKNRNSAFF